MKRQNKINAHKILVNICRLLLAVTFIFSGFVKANDPYGTLYKLNDYFASFGGIQFPEIITLVMAIGLAFIEFTLGVYLLIGINRKNVSTFTVIFMCLMTLLTIYIFLFNPVSDCGCFGDAIILTNGQTLAKNFILLAAAIYLKRYSKLQAEIVPDKYKWIISFIAMASILLYATYCIINLPVIDFRPYKVGTNLRANYESYNDPSNIEIKIIYKKNGKTLELSADDEDPDSSWTYVETRREIKNEEQLKTSNFYFEDSETGEDVTEDILYNEGTTLLIIIPDLRHADEGCVDKVNDLYECAIEKGYQFYCLTGSADPKDQTYWVEHTGAEYGFYIGEERLLKTMVRGNPGLIVIKDGIIHKKWSNYMLPEKIDSQ